MLTIIQFILSIISGIFVGFSLGLIGGGGSILAVPLLLYFVGISNMPDSAHIALGTTALAVGLNAFANSYMHFKKHNVSIKIGSLFAGIGLIGSLLGTYLGHITPGNDLLLYFAFVMILLGIYIGFSKNNNNIKSNFNNDCKHLSIKSILLISFSGFLVGLVSGYFGIGGGFLIVPALMFAASLCIGKAIGTSLISVGTFGLASGLLYLYYGDTLVIVSILFLLGGLFGGYIGTSISTKIPKRILRIVYGIIIVLVGLYMLTRA